LLTVDASVELRKSRMLPLGKLVDARTARSFQTVQPPIQTVDDLFNRDLVETCAALHMTMQELSRIRLDISRQLLCRGGATDIPLAAGLTSWRTLPAAIPALNTDVKPVRPTGIPALDGLVAGGLPAGSVVSVVGCSGAGKSHVAALTTAACALQGMRVTVISSSNDIHAKRVQASLEALIKQNQNASRPYTQAQLQDLLLFALSNVTVLHCYDVWALMDTLSKIRDRNSPAQVPDLLVVDCIHHFVAPLMTAAATGAAGISRSVSVSTLSGAGSSSGGASNAGAAAELLTSITCQVTLLLRSLAALQCTVVVMNTPASSTGLRRQSSTMAAAAGVGGGNFDGTGMGTALLDAVDIALLLERVERPSAGGGSGGGAVAGRGSWESAAVMSAAAGTTGAPAPTVIRAGKPLSLSLPMIFRACCNRCVRLLRNDCSCGAPSAVHEVVPGAMRVFNLANMSRANRSPLYSVNDVLQVSARE
jgi:RecA/RadA recombinase